MAIRVALNHRTRYQYDRPVTLSPQVVRLRPAPHCDARIESYSLKVQPEEHFANWQQDPHGNFLGRFVFPNKTRQLEIEADLVAAITVKNPFDFFVEGYAEESPFQYEPDLAKDLLPFLETEPAGSRMTNFLASIDKSPGNTVEFLVQLNNRLQRDVQYLVRMEPGVQDCEETLALRSGSCRDSAWLLVQLLRHLGLAARFVSGYLVQLKPDIAAGDGSPGVTEDSVDLHAWAEVFLPGAGWIGIDPTSGLFAGGGHIPLACTPRPAAAAPISGGVEECQMKLQFHMELRRLREDPRVTKPFSDTQWQAVDQLGQQLDERLSAADVRLTMGGEPTFVAKNDVDDPQWNTEALGEEKRQLAGRLFQRLAKHAGAGCLWQFGEGKQYPGESRPRWSLGCYWRVDGESIWQDPRWLVTDDQQGRGATNEDAQLFASVLAEELRIGREAVVPAYEDAWQRCAIGRRLPANLDSDNPRHRQEYRHQLAALVERDPGEASGFVLPLQRDGSRWQSSDWPLRSRHLFLVPGDSAIGNRLPLNSLPLSDREQPAPTPRDPTESRGPLGRSPAPFPAAASGADAATAIQPGTAVCDPAPHCATDSPPQVIVRTALCVEVREKSVRVFLPPVEKLEDYLELIAGIENTAAALATPVVLEGYPPPIDHRVRCLRITPDPGVIEVNLQPAENWPDLVSNTTTVYEEAQATDLRTDRFDLAGRHASTGGGNHFVLGGPTPGDSPFLRRPDLLCSLLTYWNNHPSLSYLFAGRFIGPTCQAPRVDEGRRDAIYELEIAMRQVRNWAQYPPWFVDRVFRHLLVDVTGNTHRAEFCIDKLYSPDHVAGRLGLVELRAFGMPPHPQMSLVQQLLIRALVARFWEAPYREKLVRWGTTLHDRFMLPYFLEQDFHDVIADLTRVGIAIQSEWFAAQFEFRFPSIGQIAYQGVHVELRQALEPWYVLGEEPGANGAARPVDTSLERLQVRIAGVTDDRYLVTCNRRQVPLHPTGIAGESVAAVRYRAWRPAACLHPNLGADAPLVFDVFDTWQGRSIGGCTYHVAHPGGRNYDKYPVNASEAEARRVARFFKTGHSGGVFTATRGQTNPEYPLTLDLRREAA